MESMNNVDKTLIHISHLHPLQLMASPEPKPICHACNMLCAGHCYGCIHCHYFLHIICATTRRSINHASHPAHPMKLELTPPYPHGQYRCDGCGVDGSSFCLRCRECSYDLHLPCAAIPYSVSHRAHRHPLILVYKNPYPPNAVPICDMCKNHLDVNKWFYICRSCDFGGHIGCFSPVRLEVLSPGFQTLYAPPQPHGAAQVGSGMNTLPQGEENLAAVMVECALRNKGRKAALSLIDDVRYERRWI